MPLGNKIPLRCPKSTPLGSSSREHAGWHYDLEIEDGNLPAYSPAEAIPTPRVNTTCLVTVALLPSTHDLSRMIDESSGCGHLPGKDRHHSCLVDSRQHISCQPRYVHPFLISSNLCGRSSRAERIARLDSRKINVEGDNPWIATPLSRLAEKQYGDHTPPRIVPPRARSRMRRMSFCGG